MNLLHQSPGPEGGGGSGPGSMLPGQTFGDPPASDVTAHPQPTARATTCRGCRSPSPLPALRRRAGGTRYRPLSRPSGRQTPKVEHQWMVEPPSTTSVAPVM